MDREEIYECRILVGKIEGRIQLGRTKLKWVDIVDTDLTGISWNNIVWIALAQIKNAWRALVSTIIKSSGCIKFGKTLK